MKGRKMFDVFTRSFWKKNPSWPNGLEPHTGRKTYIARGVGEIEARQICREYNDPQHLLSKHGLNRLRIKAEYTEF
tara:strand:- start:13 stop:240 length:228 start_codon:yes stop_codon:yes gene_type:complete